MDTNTTRRAAAATFARTEDLSALRACFPGLRLREENIAVGVSQAGTTVTIFFTDINPGATDPDLLSIAI